MQIDDRIFPTDNVYEIPSLRMDRQAEAGLLLPVGAWGTERRTKRGMATYHFYVDDYRFETLWKHPEKIVETGCKSIVEPNVSLYDTTAIACGLQKIYKKRWISRWLQEQGLTVYADLNVSKKFYEYNILGIPRGYNAFATRGYAEREEYIKEEIHIAQEISGCDAPNMLVIGGGKRIKEMCYKYGLIYVEQFMFNRQKAIRNG